VTGVIGPASAPWLVLKPIDARAGREGAVGLKGTDAYLESPPEGERDAPAARQRTPGRPTGPKGRASKGRR
jgi:hypothetical protein